MKLLDELIIFLIRSKLHLKKYQVFQFCDQKSDAMYYFDGHALMKKQNGRSEKSNVGLNWLLSPDRGIKPPRVGDEPI